MVPGNPPGVVVVQFSPAVMMLSRKQMPGLLAVALASASAWAADGNHQRVNRARTNQDYGAAIDLLEACVDAPGGHWWCQKKLRSIRFDCATSVTEIVDELPEAALLPRYENLVLLDRCTSGAADVSARKNDSKAQVITSRASATDLVARAAESPVAALEDIHRLRPVGMYDPVLDELLDEAVQTLVPSLSASLDWLLMAGHIDEAHVILDLWDGAAQGSDEVRIYEHKLALSRAAIANAAMILSALEANDVAGAVRLAREVDLAFVPTPADDALRALDSASTVMLEEEVGGRRTIKLVSGAIATAEALLVRRPSVVAQQLDQLRTERTAMVGTIVQSARASWSDWPATMYALGEWASGTLSEGNEEQIQYYLGKRYPSQVALRVLDRSDGFVGVPPFPAFAGTFATAAGLTPQTYWLVEYTVGPCAADIRLTGSKQVTSSYRAGFQPQTNPAYVQAVNAHTDAVRQHNAEAAKAEPNPYVLSNLESAATRASYMVNVTPQTIRVPITLSYLVNAEYYEKTWGCGVSFRVSHAGKTLESGDSLMSRTEEAVEVSGAHGADLNGLVNKSISFSWDRKYASAFWTEVSSKISGKAKYLREDVWADVARQRDGKDEAWQVRLEAVGLYLARANDVSDVRRSKILALLEEDALRGYLDALGQPFTNPIVAPFTPGQQDGTYAATLEPPRGAGTEAHPQPPNGADEPRRFAGALETVRQNVCIVETPGGTGSGVILAPWGVLVTNAHVVEDYVDVVVRFADGSEQVAVVVARDQVRDLAFVEIVVPNGIKGILLRPTGEILVGEEAYAVGVPVMDELSWSLTKGIVSQVRNGSPTLIQTDTPVNPGNSGGPLVDKAGRVIGIVVWKLRSAEGLGFAIASDEVAAFLLDAMVSR